MIPNVTFGANASLFQIRPSWMAKIELVTDRIIYFATAPPPSSHRFRQPAKPLPLNPTPSKPENSNALFTLALITGRWGRNTNKQTNNNKRFEGSSKCGQRPGHAIRCDAASVSSYKKRSLMSNPGQSSVALGTSGVLRWYMWASKAY